MNQITGTTKVLGILADPIHHVQTPQGINAIFDRCDIDAVMIPLHVDSTSLPLLIPGLRSLRNLEGFVVTVPHKAAMLKHCDEASPAAAQIGAVNVVRRTADGRLIGDMLDGDGFVQGLQSEGIEVRGRSVYVAGAGGAASAIVYALAGTGASLITIANRTPTKAHELVERLSKSFPGVTMRVGTSDPGGHEIVVNATSLGLRPGEPLPLDASRLHAAQIVAEIVMKPRVTPLLAEAMQRGCRVHFGEPMLRSQLELMARFMRS
jgi:shikimate dehydrogenase